VGKSGVTVALFHTLSREEAAAARAAVLALPGATEYWQADVGGNLTLSISIDSPAVAALAEIPGVQYVEPSSQPVPRNDTTRWIVQSNQLGVYPLYTNNLKGEGQIVGILDTPVNANHCSFSDTVPIGPGHRKIVAYNATPGSSSHGTHVAGIAVGDAGNETATRGNAYLGRLTYGPIPSFTEVAVVTALNLHHTQGARVHTNSWGDDGTTAYNGLCRGFDAFQYNNEDSFVCLAVTNLSALKNPENAKNLLAVGNCFDTPNQGNISTGGAGPTSDGRRKPEIFAPGDNVNSASSGTACGTTQLTGTSMASPAIAGVAMMTREYFMDGFYPGGVATTANAFTPSSALVKAMIINSGVDMTGPAGYPSNAEGWGRVLADNALYFFGDARKLLIQEKRNNQGLATGGQEVVNVNVLGSNQQVRFTLVWTEPPAASGAAFASINNLDLEVDSPTGTYKGNVFTGGSSTTGGTADDRNNVEQVHINNPVPGAYTVRIKGTNVAQGLQGYAFTVTGNIEGGEPPPLVINLAGAVPALIPPGQATDLTVQVIPGAQQVVPGSPAMLYRTSPAGSFTSLPMTPLTGNDYRATLPPFDCTDVPQFYFRAEGDQGAVALLPSNAPTTALSTTIGTIQINPVTSEGFESGLPAGWTANGLWKVTTNTCGVGAACEGSSIAYYGNVPGCNYNTGAANTGTLTSSLVALPAVPPGGSITLSYCSSLQTENNSSYDHADVLVNGTVVDSASESATWQTRNVDLSSFAGQSVAIAFRFDTVDGVLNEFRGWQVDQIKIEAAGLVCDSCYPDCNQSGNLTIADFGCFQAAFSAGNTYADCNNSQSLTIADFGCFQAAFSKGCP
jgi:hypothetical protein